MAEPKYLNTLEATTYLHNLYWLLGIQRPKKYKILYNVYSLIINGLCTVCLPVFFTLSYLRIFMDKNQNKEFDIGYLLTSLQVAIDVYGCGIKVVIMCFLMPKLHSSHAVLRRLDARCQYEEELAIQRKIIRFGRRFLIFTLVVYASYSVSTFFSSIINGRAPYSIFLPGLDWKRSKWEFYVVSFLEFQMMNVAVLQQTANDFYAVIYICLLRAHLKILAVRIKKITKNPQARKRNEYNLKLCIADHNQILEYYGIIAPIISTTLFIQFTVTSSILGTTLINILLFTTDFSARIASMFYLIAVTLEIFPQCYFAQCLVEDSDSLRADIFHSNWYEQSQAYRKTLIFMLHRSQQAIRFTAGKLFEIDLNNFINIAKFSFSLYTLIKGIKEK